MPKKSNRAAAFELVDRAIRLQLSDDGDLSEIEEYLQKALTLDSDGIEVLEEVAHFYDAVVPKRSKARKFATQCREKALKLVAEMDSIIKGESSLAKNRHFTNYWFWGTIWGTLSRTCAASGVHKSTVGDRMCLMLREKESKKRFTTRLLYQLSYVG